MPIRTWLPLTPSTVTLTESPIIRVSRTRRVRINIFVSLHGTVWKGIPDRLDAPSRSATTTKGKDSQWYRQPSRSYKEGGGGGREKMRRSPCVDGGRERAE